MGAEMTKTQVLALLVGLAAVGPALADEAPQQPQASARLLSAPSGMNRWYGVGDAASKVQMCVSSNTGRFSLNLTPRIASSDASRPREIEVVFATAGGDRQARRWDGQTDLVFNGRVVDDACGAGGNVSIEFRIDQQNLIAVVAGDYVNQMRFTVEPA